MVDIVYAMTGSPGATGGQTNMNFFVLMIIIFAIFYFLLIMPQQRKMKKHREFLSSLEKGKTVLTSSGIYGKVTGITENVVTLEIAPNVKIKIARDQIMGYSETKTD